MDSTSNPNPNNYISEIEDVSQGTSEESVNSNADDRASNQIILSEESCSFEENGLMFYPNETIILLENDKKIIDDSLKENSVVISSTENSQPLDDTGVLLDCTVNEKILNEISLSNEPPILFQHVANDLQSSMLLNEESRPTETGTINI